MDELKDILWIVGAIGTIALSFVSQKRQKPAARVAGEPEAFPTPAAEPLSGPRKAEAPVVRRQDRMESKSGAHKGRAGEGSGRRKADSRKPHATDGVAKAAGDEIGDEPKNPAAEAGDAGLASEFDVRKAVVWSEILKPKFDEE